MARGRYHSILTRYAVGTTVAMLMAGVLSVLFVYFGNVASANEHWAQMADKAKMLIDDCFEDTTYDELFSSDTSEEYVSFRYTMQEFERFAEVDCIYLYVVNPERTERTFLFSASRDEEEDENLRLARSLNAVSATPLTQSELQTLDGACLVLPEEMNAGFGDHYCWFRLIELPSDRGQALMGLDQSVSLYRGLIDTDMWEFAGLMGAFLAGIAVLELILLRRNVVKPIQEVTAHMNEFAEKGMATDRIRVHRRDEIGQIAVAFNQMTMDVEQSVQKIEEMTEERVAADTEMQVAKRIQQVLVPDSKHIKRPGFEAFAFARTARAVGGDFYDMFELDDGRVVLLIADVSGKGVSAALSMSVFMTLLHEKLSGDPDPARVLNTMNDMIAAKNPENMFVTLIAGVYDPATGILTYANAGHTQPLVVGEGFLEPDLGIALGLFEDAGIVNETFVLQPGDGIVLYTDGTTEANDLQQQFFGEDRLVQAVVGAHDARDAVETIVRAVDAFTGSAEQFDDLTLLSFFALERTPDKRTWKTVLAPELSEFEEVHEHLEELCDGAEDVFSRALLACDEGFANVTSYSGASRVELEITRTHACLEICMSDDGTPFDPLGHEGEDIEFEDLEFGGMGISFIKQSCDELTYAYEDGKNVLSMRFFM